MKDFHIFRDILLKNGSAVEAAIAALFCEGVVCVQSMGLGGGFLMTIYKRGTGEVRTLNAREVAPKAANKTMFNGNSTLSTVGMHSYYPHLRWILSYMDRSTRFLPKSTIT
jgi:gamma-glutamyltranspeptidase/glutathione hydrolase/leukotriene-C4 hydrolase